MVPYKVTSRGGIELGHIEKGKFIPTPEHRFFKRGIPGKDYNMTPARKVQDFQHNPINLSSYNKKHTKGRQSFVQKIGQKLIRHFKNMFQ